MKCVATVFVEVENVECKKMSKLSMFFSSVTFLSHQPSVMSLNFKIVVTKNLLHV